MSTSMLKYAAAAASLGCVILLSARAETAQMPADWDAGGSRVGAAIKLGTLGPGAEVILGLTPKLHLRGGINYLPFTYSDTFDDVEYDLTTDFLNVGLLADFHPGEGLFRLTAGLLVGDNSMELEGTPEGSVSIGGNSYPAALVGTITGDVKMNSFSPYIGIGFGNAVRPDRRWTFSTDIGVMFQSYDVELSASGPAAAVPQFQADLREEEQDIQDDLDSIPIYPVLSMGVAYHF